MIDGVLAITSAMVAYNVSRMVIIAGSEAVIMVGEAGRGSGWDDEEGELEPAARSGLTGGSRRRLDWKMRFWYGRGYTEVGKMFAVQERSVWSDF